MFGLGTTELLIIFAIVFLLFGAKKVPELMKGIGGGMREMRRIGKDLEENFDEKA